MGRGEDLSEKEAVESPARSGAAALPEGVSQIRISRAALQSWAGLRGVSGDRVVVRKQMLDEIDLEGEISSSPPEWMTSPREAAGWVHLRGDVSLLLSESSDAAEPLWLASAAVAPRGVRRNSPGAKLHDRGWSPREIRALLRQEPRDVLFSARFSKHCAERLAERAGRELSSEETAEWVSRESSREGAELGLKMAPDWAASGSRMPALLLTHAEGQELAFLIAPEGEDAEPVIVTVISREWAEASLREIPETVKLQNAKTAAAAGWDDERLRAELSEVELYQTPDSPGHWLRASSGALILVRPSASGWTAVEIRS